MAGHIGYFLLFLGLELRLAALIPCPQTTEHPLDLPFTYTILYTFNFSEFCLFWHDVDGSVVQFRLPMFTEHCVVLRWSLFQSFLLEYQEGICSLHKFLIWDDKSREQAHCSTVDIQVSDSFLTMSYICFMCVQWRPHEVCCECSTSLWFPGKTCHWACCLMNSL
jgi:hypothetical protein